MAAAALRSAVVVVDLRSEVVAEHHRLGAAAVVAEPRRSVVAVAPLRLAAAASVDEAELAAVASVVEVAAEQLRESWCFVPGL